MTNFVILAIIVILTILAAFVYRDNKANVFKAAGVVITIILIFFVSLNIYFSNRMPIILKDSESYIMNVNEAKSNKDTNVKLKKVFMDLNSINMTYWVSGKEKVVAVELKRNPDDSKPINKFTGLWVGGRILPESSFVGMSYASDEFISPIYAVFYLSDGSSIPFEIRDRANVKDSVRIVSINKTLDYNGSTLTLNKFYKGLNYSSVGFKANFSPSSEIIDMKLLVNGSEMKEGSHGWSGGGDYFTGSFGFDPVSSESIKLKVINKQLNRTDIIELDMK